MISHSQIEEFYRERAELYVIRLSNRAGGVMNAEDVVQEAFLRALLYSDSFNPELTEFETWFNSIVHRSLIDFKRAELRLGESIDYEDLPEDEQEAYSPPDPELRRLIQEEIGNVKNVEHRNILFLFYQRSYKLSEIDRIVKSSYRNIRGVIGRFREEMIEKYG